MVNSSTGPAARGEGESALLRAHPARPDLGVGAPGRDLARPARGRLRRLRAAVREHTTCVESAEQRTALFTSRRWNVREWSVQLVDVERSCSVSSPASQTFDNF